MKPRTLQWNNKTILATKLAGHQECICWFFSFSTYFDENWITVFFLVAIKMKHFRTNSHFGYLILSIIKKQKYLVLFLFCFVFVFNISAKTLECEFWDNILPFACPHMQNECSVGCAHECVCDLSVYYYFKHFVGAIFVHIVTCSCLIQTNA